MSPESRNIHDLLSSGMSLGETANPHSFRGDRDGQIAFSATQAWHVISAPAIDLTQAWVLQSGDSQPNSRVLNA
jgi:hypothetical protein